MLLSPIFSVQVFVKDDSCYFLLSVQVFVKDDSSYFLLFSQCKCLLRTTHAAVFYFLRKTLAARWRRTRERNTCEMPITTWPVPMLLRTDTKRQKPCTRQTWENFSGMFCSCVSLGGGRRGEGSVSPPTTKHHTYLCMFTHGSWEMTFSSTGSLSGL